MRRRSGNGISHPSLDATKKTEPESLSSCRGQAGSILNSAQFNCEKTSNCVIKETMHPASSLSRRLSRACAYLRTDVILHDII